VDEDETAARRAFTRSMMGYAMGRGGRPQGYRAHFERMGYAAELARIDEMRAKNAPAEEVIDAFPDGLVRSVGYYGKAAGAREAFARLSAGLDTAIVRVVGVRPGIEATRNDMRALAPAG
jgi:hypothetical protein